MLYTTMFIDLDDTVYPASCGLWEAIRERIDLYMLERVHIPADMVSSLRKRLFSTYGTTMRGLVAEYGINQEDYLAFVHDVPLTHFIIPDPNLGNVLGQYPQRKIIFTNADANHAKRVLGVLGISDCFDQIIDIHSMAPYCKPQPDAFRIAMNRAGENDPGKCILIDDALFNLVAARKLGFFTIRLGNGNPGPDYHECIDTLNDLPKVLAPSRE